MSDEKQQDLPGIPTSGLASINQKNMAAALASLPPLDWGEAPTGPSNPKTVPQGDRTLSLPLAESGATANTSKAGSSNGTLASPQAKPSRKRGAAAQENKAMEVKPADLAGAQEAPTAAPKRPRTRKNNKKALASPEQPGRQSGQQPSAESDIPQVTDEAIAFLNTPDAKASDLFKLQPASRAFVHFHIANMQRLEAASELANASLLAVAPKFSPQFEKVADAMLKRLAKGNQPKAGLRTAAAVEQSAKVSLVSYHPRSDSILPQVQVPVQLRNIDIRPSVPSSTTERTEQLENVIERGIVRERSGEAQQDKQALGSPGSAAAPDTSVSPPMLNMTVRIVRAISSKAQAAEAWLTRSGNDGPSAPVPFELRPRGQPTVRIVSASSTAAELTAMPDSVSRRFLNVNQDYYFPDRTHAFRDNGHKLATRGEHPEVIRSLIEIARARGWDSITVKGTDLFRRGAWLEASRSGLMVDGYKPSALELAELAQQPARNIIEKENSRDRGTAATNPPDRQPDPGRSEGTTRVRPTATQPSIDTASNAELVAKAKAFENNKPAFVVKKHPELAPAYGVVDAAKKFAEANLPESAREEFIGLARRHVMQKIIAGEHVRGPRIHATRGREHEAQEHSGIKATAPVDPGKSARAKDVAKER